jgi:MoaA/NifB/PqqE/SkfB family radical SAM enzyme
MRLKKRSKLNFNVKITDHCNLNCACCNQLAPVSDKACYPVETFKKDCLRLFQLGGKKISRIIFTGGEPLLHPQVTDFFDVARECFNSYGMGGGGGGVCFITNAVLLPKKDESFWLNCKKNNVAVWITKYPINVNYESIEKTAKKYDVIIYYFGETDLFTKTLFYMPYDLTGKQNIKKTFKLCFYSNECVFLSDGKLYPCCGIPPVHIFNKYFNKNLIVSDADSIDIYAAENMEQIFDFLCKPVPFCRYCDWERCDTQIPWHTSSRQISEWT